MASPTSGTSSGSSSLQICEDNQQMDLRKRKRMLSNRESARRSRMRKQKLLDDLTAQMNNLRAENNQILMNMNLVTQLYLDMESENSVLRAQMSELNHRLQTLNEIICCLSSQGDSAHGFEEHGDFDKMINRRSDDFLNSWSLIHVNQPIVASPDIFLY